MMRTSLGLGLRTRTLKVNWPPGSGRVRGLASLMTSIWGGMSVMATVASSVSVAGLPLWSVAVAVTVSVRSSPGAPVNGAVKLQGSEVAPGCRTSPMRAPHVEP